MKKKLFLALAISIMLVCFFAISIGAEEVLNEGNALITSTSDEFATGENINYITGLANEIYFNGTSSQNNKALSLEQRMVLKNDDGTYSTFPSAYLFDISKDGSKRAQRFQWLDVTLINNATGQTYEPADLIRLEIPEGIVDIHHDDRTSNARIGTNSISDLNAVGLKYLSFPASCTGTLSMGNFAQGLTALEEVDFSKMTNPYYFNMGSAFYQCTNLAKVTFPQTLNSDNGNMSTCVIGEYMFYQCSKLTSISLPNEITQIGKQAFRQTGLTSLDISNTRISKICEHAFNTCASLVTVKMPTTLTQIDAAAFQSCTALQFVDFGDNQNTFTMPGWGVFYNCTSLVAISLPAKTQSIPDRGFSNCTNLKAFYMGEEITALCGNKGDGTGDGPAFAACTNLYFVQNAFNVTDENGDFYTAETFTQPAKPKVYYFPSTLVRICNTGNRNTSHTMDENGHVQNTGNDDLAFANCKNLNTYLVFPEGFTGFDDISNTLNPDQRGDTMGKGFMHNCATKENPVTLVFLGRIDRVSMDRRNGQTSYMTYMFANPANTGFENTLIGSYIGDSYYSNQNEMYVIFCHAEGGAQKYQINFVASEADANVPVLSPTKVEGASSSWHAHAPRADKYSDETCTSPAGNATYCFCGEEINFVAVEGSVALGHLYDNLTDKYYPTVNEVPNYFANAIHQYLCPQCNENIEREEEGTNLFTNYGYSASEADPTIISYTVYANAELIQAYAEYKGVDVKYGLVVSATANGTPLTYENDTLTTDVNTVKIEMSGSRYNKLTVKVANVPTADMALHCNGYVVVNGDIAYLNHSTVDKTAATVTHSSILELINTQAPAPEDETAE